MNGSTKGKVSSMQHALNVIPQLGFRKMKMKSNDTIDIFYVFWKYLGVTGAFLLGLTFTWWGTNILLNDWVRIRTVAGPFGNMVLIPLAVGLVLSWLSFAEFLRIIRER